MNNSTFIRFLKVLFTWWQHSAWLTHDLSNQRSTFIDRIRQTKGE